MISLALRVLLAIGLLAAILPPALRLYAALRFRPLTYSAESVPPRQVGIVFGARVYGNGRPSAMLADRVAAGADLYHRGRVQVLLMTGDNSSLDYNEPQAMRAYALELGVPDEAIVLDYAGRRTYDSCYRARDIFGVAEAVLVTQNFHLDRALLICRGLGIDAVGVAADYQRPWGYSRHSLNYSRLREFPATALAVLDLIRRPAPILGEPLPIFPAEGDGPPG